MIGTSVAYLLKGRIFFTPPEDEHGPRFQPGARGRRPGVWLRRTGRGTWLDPGAVAEDGTPEEDRSDAPEGCKAQPLQGEGHESTTLR